MRKFETISVTNTIGQWVDAYNNNALAASDHTWYLGEMLYNGILYTGLETIGGEKIASLVNTPINHVSPQNVELDNFYLYFRDVNKVLLVDQVTFDLRPYATGHPMYFYINSELGFRCDSEFKQEKNEICLFRFILSKGEVFQQCYITAQRFGSNVYDTADEFFLVKGCVPTCYEGLQIKFGNGTIKRSGIKFDNHQMPDLLEIEDKPKPFNIRYIENDNTVNFSKDPVKVLDPSEYLDYNSHTFKTVPKDKFSIQRILYDPYTDCIIMQYGNMLFSDMQSALTSINNVDFPFPYDTLMFIPMGIAIMSGECKDLSDINNCMLVQQLSTTINPQDSVFFAEDSYARGRLDALRNDIEQLQAQIDAANARIDAVNKRVDDANTRMDGMDDRMDGIDVSITNVNNRVDTVQSNLNTHTTNKSNPHSVTKAQVGLGNVENKSVATIKSELLSSGDFVKTDSTDQTVGGTKTFDHLTVDDPYIKVNGRKLFVGGSNPSGSNGDFWLPD